MKHGKKYVESAKLIDRASFYETEEAVALVKKSATAKFDETVEVHIRTGCDGRHAEQQIRGAVVLPNGTGKTVRVLVFAKGDKVAEAEAAGAKGLMPNPKAGTVTMDVTKAINDIKAGKIEYRLDKTNIIHCPIGKASFTEEQLLQNLNTLLEALVKVRPSSLKGQYLKSITLATTMGPGVKVSVAKF